MQTQAEFYSSRATDRPVVDDRLKKVIELACKGKFTSVLDIGCGRGTLLQSLREGRPDTSFTGIELSDEPIAIAKASGLRVLKHDLAEGLPFPDETFDLVIFGEVIEHLFDPDAALDEIYRVLKPKGRCIVTTPNLACWINRILLLSGIQPIFTETSARKKYGRGLTVFGQNSTAVVGHIRVMTKTALVEMLKDRHYLVSKVIGYKFQEFGKMFITDIVDGMFCAMPALSSGIIAVAEKK